MDTSKVKAHFKELWTERSFRLQVVGGFLLMAMTMPLAMWAFDTEEPLKFDAEKSLIIPAEAHGGDQMLVMWALKQPPRKGCTGEVRRKLVDPTTKVLIAAYDIEKSGGVFQGGYLKKTFMLPTAAPKGWIAYKSDLCYACNPLQQLISAARICYSTPDLLFKVL
jgi:hypothetical protein